MHAESLRYWKISCITFKLTKIHKFTDPPPQCVSLCVFILAPLLSISPPPWMEGVGGNGRDHYITKHPQATILSNCHTRLPIHCLRASGQVLCGTPQMQGGWEEKVEWRDKRNHKKDLKEEGEWDKRGGGIETKHHMAGLSTSPWVQTTSVVIGHTWHLCLYDPDNVCLNIEKLQRVKARPARRMPHRLVPPPSFFRTPTETWGYLLPAMNIRPALIS